MLPLNLLALLKDIFTSFQQKSIVGSFLSIEGVERCGGKRLLPTCNGFEDQFERPYHKLWDFLARVYHYTYG